jgi:hypothetical protein
MKPLCIDLYCGLGGWTEGFLAEGYDCIGFDIERHDYGSGGYPSQLVLQDVLTLHGSQFRDAACIVASPPCQEFSSRAMPWKRRAAALARAVAIWEDDGGSAKGTAAMPIVDTRLFDACFRIQREASEAAGHHIPLVVENVKGAQPWVGRAAWHHGSYFLWGDVPALMLFTSGVKGNAPRGDGKNPKGTGATSWFFQGRSDPRDSQGAIETARKNNGGSWFAQAHNTESGHSRNPVTGEGIKQGGSGAAWFDKALDERRKAAGTKAGGHSWASGSEWQERRNGDSFGWSKGTPLRNNNSHSTARKEASAQIAKIPFELASHIARCFKP